MLCPCGYATSVSIGGLRLRPGRAHSWAPCLLGSVATHAQHLCRHVCVIDPPRSTPLLQPLRRHGGQERAAVCLQDCPGLQRRQRGGRPCHLLRGGGAQRHRRGGEASLSRLSLNCQQPSTFSKHHCFHFRNFLSSALVQAIQLCRCSPFSVRCLLLCSCAAQPPGRLARLPACILLPTNTALATLLLCSALHRPAAAPPCPSSTTWSRAGRPTHSWEAQVSPAGARRRPTGRAAVDKETNGRPPSCCHSVAAAPAWSALDKARRACFPLCSGCRPAWSAHKAHPQLPGWHGDAGGQPAALGCHPGVKLHPDGRPEQHYRRVRGAQYDGSMRTQVSEHACFPADEVSARKHHLRCGGQPGDGFLLQPSSNNHQLLCC